MTRIVEDLKQGADVTTAMRNQADVYPELFRNMVEIGDQTGKLPEVLRSLADHYDNSLPAESGTSRRRSCSPSSSSPRP